MFSPALHDVLECLPHAVVRLDDRLRVLWRGPNFGARFGVEARPGDPLGALLEPGEPRDHLESALRQRRVYFGAVVTRTLAQVWARARPLDGGGSLLVFEASGPDDPVGFTSAFQEIARAVSETLDVDAACAAAAVAMVRSAQIARAEVYLDDGGGALRRVASSNVSGATPAPEANAARWDAVRHALATRQPQLGVAMEPPELAGCIFAAVPVAAQRRAIGVLVLYKARGDGFSMRELELWSAVGGQLGVAVENGRLFHEAQAALKVREDFMSIASHELKTPLTTLAMTLHAMDRSLSTGHAVDVTAVAKSKKQVRRLSALVNDLLDSSHVERGRLTVERVPLELGLLAHDVVNAFRSAHGREVELDIPRERVWVRGDHARLEQVLVNLLQNAHKYSPERGAIRVVVSAEDGLGSLAVIDHGIGVPESEQARIFDRFYRAQNSSSRNFGGLGLGLFISRAILELHRGTLSLESREGSGSTFVARLPTLEPEEIAALPRRVLVFDADPERRGLHSAALGAAGFDVAAAENAAEALVRASQLPLDAVLVADASTPSLAAALEAALRCVPPGREVPVLLSAPERPPWAPRNALLLPQPFSPQAAAQAIDGLFSSAPGDGAEVHHGHARLVQQGAGLRIDEGA